MYSASSRSPPPPGGRHPAPTSRSELGLSGTRVPSIEEKKPPSVPRTNPMRTRLRVSSGRSSCVERTSADQRRPSAAQPLNSPPSAESEESMPPPQQPAARGRADQRASPTTPESARET